LILTFHFSLKLFVNFKDLNPFLQLLNRRAIAGFLYEVPAHGVAGIMGRVSLDAGQAAYFVEHRIEE